MNTKISLGLFIMSSIVLLSACRPSVTTQSPPAAVLPQRVAASQASVRTAVLELGRRYDQTQPSAQAATVNRTMVLELGSRYDRMQSSVQPANSDRTMVLELGSRYDRATTAWPH